MSEKIFPYRETAEKLREIRGDLSKRVFAAKLGIPYQTYLRYETGERETPSRFLDKARELIQDAAAKTGHSVVTEEPQVYGTPYIAKVAALMADMDIETQKDICLSVEKEKLLRDLLRQKELDKKAG